MAAAAAARRFDDFVPSHSLVEEPNSKTLLVDLSGSGFKKEELRVQIDDYGRLRISGERQLQGGRWSRFRKDLRVPEGCDAGGIGARFDKDGVLHITVPRLSPPGPVAADARRTPAAKPQEENKRQVEEEKKEELDGERKRSHGQDGRAADEGNKRQEEEVAGGRGEPVAPPAFGFVRDRRRRVRRTLLLLGVALALVGAAGLYARYRWMDPSAAPPAGDHAVALSDH